MKITRGNVRCAVAGSPEERAFLRDYLTVDTGRRNRNDGAAITFCMYFDLGNTFPAGYHPLVVRAARDAGLAVEVDDQRPPRIVPAADADIGWLRDDQRAAVDAIERLRRGVVRLPTGAGKTEVAVAAGLRLASADAPMLFVVDSTDLMLQAAARWEKRTGEAAGRLGDGERVVGERFTAATFATLRAGLKSRRHELSRFRILVVDECHGLPASSHYKVAAACSGADYRIGLSATPHAGDPTRTATLTGLLGPIIYEVGTQELVQRGVIAKARVALIRHEKVSAATEWPEAQAECIVENDARNRDVVLVAKRAAKPCLVFVRAVDHGHLLVKKLQRAGLNADFAWGKCSTRRREDLTKRLVRGDLDVLVCNQIFYKGVDIPSLASAINAAGGASDIDTLQRLGRGTRIVRDEKTGEVLKASFDYFDFFDTGHPWTERHARERRRAYLDEGHEVVFEEAEPAQLALPVGNLGAAMQARRG